MNCPRCGGALREHKPNEKWQRFFECEECWMAFEPFMETTRVFPAHYKGARGLLARVYTMIPGRTRSHFGTAA